MKTAKHKRNNPIRIWMWSFKAETYVRNISWPIRSNIEDIKFLRYISVILYVHQRSGRQNHSSSRSFEKTWVIGRFERQRIDDSKHTESNHQSINHNRTSSSPQSALSRLPGSESPTGWRSVPRRRGAPAPTKRMYREALCPGVAYMGKLGGESKRAWSISVRG